MNYSETVGYITEISDKGSVMGLDSIKNLLKKLDNPEKCLKVVHFAGTNGKGSTVAFVESILKKAGYRVGKYTSPAVFEYREIIQFEGEYISEEEYARNMSLVMEDEGMGHPTAFEMETALAFLYLSKKDTDIMLLETGMGGLTDATNIMESVLCSVLTTIGLDHMAFLGETLADITRIKAGIIKRNCPVVTYEQSDEIMEVIKSVCEKKNSELYVAEIKDYETAVAGNYQKINSSIAVKVAQVLRNYGFFITDNDIINGIGEMQIFGRYERICNNPLIIIDGAHNPCAAVQLRNTIDRDFSDNRLIFIMGAYADKDYSSVAGTVLRKEDTVFTVSTKGKRKLDAKKLAGSIRGCCARAIAADTIDKAVEMALDEMKKGEAKAVIAFGSLSFLGELKRKVKDKCL